MMEQKERSETTACKIQMLGNYPEESTQQYSTFKAFLPTNALFIKT
jgi:hypothetical protein